MKLALRARDTYKKVTLFTAAFVLAVSSLTASVPFILSQKAAAVASPYIQGFEWGSSDWSNSTIVSDGADGFASSEGTHYARVSAGAFTGWGNDRSRNAFPVGGYSTSVDLYLKMDTASGGADKRVNYTSAINNQNGNHRRDFILHFGTNPAVDNQWVVSASNNSPGNPVSAANNAVINQDGWYTLKHDFKNVNGILSVDLSVVRKADNTLIKTWTLSDQSDVIDAVIGGARYGWFTADRFDIPYVAIDNVRLTVNNAPQPTAPQNGALQYTDASSVFGWDAVPGAQEYEVRYSQNPSRNPNNNDGQLTNPLGTAITANSTTTVENLPVGILFWQVRGIFDGQPGPWSNIWSTTLGQNQFVSVSPENLNGWVLSGTSGGQSTLAVVPSPVTGQGALHLVTNSDNQARANATLPQDFALKDVYSMSYQTRQNGASSTVGSAAYRIQIDADGDLATTTDRLNAVHEPYWQNSLGDPDPVVPGVWQQWNVKDGIFWISIDSGNAVSGFTNGGGGGALYTYDQLKAALPNAKVVGINTGIGSYNQDYNIDVDQVVIGKTINGGPLVTTYDFEPDVTPPTIPTVAYTQDSNGASVASNGFTNSKYFTFNLGSSSDTTRYQLKYWNTIPGATVQSWNPTDLSSHSTSLGVYKDNFTQGEGTHYFSFSACDASGNCSPFSSPFVVEYDITAPTVSVNAATFLTTDATQTVGGTSEPGSVITLTVDDVQVANNITVDSEGIWSYTFSTPYGQGTYNLEAVATDAAGNKSVKNSGVTTNSLVVTTPVVNPTNPVTPPAGSDQGGDEEEEGVPANTQSDNDANGGLPLANFGIVQQVLGDSTNNNQNNENGTPEVEGVSTQNTVAQAVNSDANQGRFLGLAWYWWILILAAIALIGWWIAAAIRRRRAEEN